jgi:hypothetical protein
MKDENFRRSVFGLNFLDLATECQRRFRVALHVLQVVRYVRLERRGNFYSHQTNDQCQEIADYYYGHTNFVGKAR